ncbi:hypothetical protein C8R44DRAFT_887598 [Mycena epipterygia]|nr:hypothetical protein C8R44DRAFT_887598 [Mycena epipterygia]
MNTVDQKRSFYVAVEAIFRTEPLVPFPRFESRANRDATVCTSYALRTGLENVGDQIMYCCLGFTLRALCPDHSRAFYHDVIEVLTSNWAFGWYLRCRKMFHGVITSGSKEGGDVFETLIGGILDDSNLLAVQRWVDIAMRPFIIACASIDSPRSTSLVLGVKNADLRALTSAFSGGQKDVNNAEVYLKTVLDRLGFPVGHPAPMLVIPTAVRSQKRQIDAPSVIRSDKLSALIRPAPATALKSGKENEPAV